MAEAYPLHWPAGWKRTTRPKRSGFNTGFAVARDGLFREISRMGGRLPVLSTNVTLKQNGLPYANQAEPEDRGAAIYFQYKDKTMCFACDQYDRVRDNIQALRKTIEAIRGIERWGASDMMERAFSGFEALPDPAAAGGQRWNEILQMGNRQRKTDQQWLAEAERNYRILRKDAHPDHGGTEDGFIAIQRAIEQARQELGHG